MDKKTELLLRRGQPAAPAVDVTSAPAAPPPAPAYPPEGWWMYHGGPCHTGFVSNSGINSTTVGPLNNPSPAFGPLFTLNLAGPVLSVPAISNGFVYVGLANSQVAQGGNGGSFRKIDLTTGAIAFSFDWDLGTDAPDAHSFAGMGCTPAVINGRVYFGAFNGKFYCLDADTLAQVWITDLRNADTAQNQPVTNTAGVSDGFPPAVIWSSPVVSKDGSRLYVGCGEGENPQLFSFVFCLDTATGSVKWIFCTNKFSSAQDNLPNDLPAPVLTGTVPPQYTSVQTPPIAMGCSVWGAIAYDPDTELLYCSTGNQQPEPNGNWSWDGTGQPPPFTPELPSAGYSNGVLSLHAGTGQFSAFFQVPYESCYRPSDIDIDLGGAPSIVTLNGTKVVAVGCKNGSCFLLDPATLQLLKQRQMLPYHNDGSRIDTVDSHPWTGDINPQIPGALSDKVPNENFSGVFNTGAIYPGSEDSQLISPRIFFGMGGPNYHSQSPGIDFESTPFMRAIDLTTMADAWPLDNSDPRRYLNATVTDPSTEQTVGMYANAGESGLSSPAIVNDVVFCATSKIGLYAFKVSDGTLLWHDDLGAQTDGYNGGYGYCLGPAICGDYVVAGALVFGLTGGGVLKIYGFQPK